MIFAVTSSGVKFTSASLHAVICALIVSSASKYGSSITGIVIVPIEELSGTEICAAPFTSV